MTTAVGPAIDGLQFLSHLGEGGYSDVFLYERRSPRMKVAVKVLKGGRLSAAELTQFETEAETMAELSDHPNIVQVFSADKTADGRPYLIMKYYPKPNLGRRAATERFSIAEVLRTGVKISGAVETAHRAGILHRDVKPANILVSQYDEPGLADFGIAGRATDTDNADDLGVSIPWSPPEVLDRRSNGSVAADVYSLAATLWHLLVGRSPFEMPKGGDNGTHAFVQRVLRTPPPPTGRGDTPASLERLLQQALAKNPAVRPRSALEFAQSLQAIEQELRLDRTEIRVAGLQAPPSAVVRRSVDRDDSTRLRAATRVSPQRPPSQFAPKPASAERAKPSAVDKLITGPPKGPDVAARSPRERLLPSDEGVSSTLRRAVPVRPDADVEAKEPRRGVRPRVVVLAASAVVLVAVVVGIALASGGGTPAKQNAALPSLRATDQTPAPVDVPIPKVKATYSAATKAVRFSWTVPHREAGDSYLYGLFGSTDGTRTTENYVVVKTGSPTVTCIVVTYVTAAGAHSDPSPRVCGPAK